MQLIKVVSFKHGAGSQLRVRKWNTWKIRAEKHVAKSCKVHMCLQCGRILRFNKKTSVGGYRGLVTYENIPQVVWESLYSLYKPTKQGENSMDETDLAWRLGGKVPPPWSFAELVACSHILTWTGNKGMIRHEGVKQNLFRVEKRIEQKKGDEIWTIHGFMRFHEHDSL